MRKRSSFTVMELLVILAVLGILLFVLLQWLAKVRENSRPRFCKSNLKQIGLAYAQYCDDYNGRPPSKGNSGEQAYLDAIQLLGPYTSYSPKLWVCGYSKDVPAATVLPTGLSGTNMFYDWAPHMTLTNVSYAWEPDTIWQGTNDMALFWDRGVDPTGTNHWTSSAHGRTEGGNVLWNDGHVEWMRVFPGGAAYSNAVHR